MSDCPDCPDAPDAPARPAHLPLPLALIWVGMLAGLVSMVLPADALAQRGRARQERIARELILTDICQCFTPAVSPDSAAVLGLAGQERRLGRCIIGAASGEGNARFRQVYGDLMTGSKPERDRASTSLSLDLAAECPAFVAYLGQQAHVVPGAGAALPSAVPGSAAGPGTLDTALIGEYRRRLLGAFCTCLETQPLSPAPDNAALTQLTLRCLKQVNGQYGAEFATVYGPLDGPTEQVRERGHRFGADALARCGHFRQLTQRSMSRR